MKIKDCCIKIVGQSETLRTMFYIRVEFSLSFYEFPGFPAGYCNKATVEMSRCALCCLNG